MLKNWLAAGAVTLTVGMTSTIAHAQSTTVPGEQVGLAVGAPLPEGIYALNTFTYRRTDGPFTPDTAVNIPVLVWSPPFVPFGGRLDALVAPPPGVGLTRTPAAARRCRRAEDVLDGRTGKSDARRADEPGPRPIRRGVPPASAGRCSRPDRSRGPS